MTNTKRLNKLIKALEENKITFEEYQELSDVIFKIQIEIDFLKERFSYCED